MASFIDYCWLGIPRAAMVILGLRLGRSAIPSENFSERFPLTNHYIYRAKYFDHLGMVESAIAHFCLVALNSNGFRYPVGRASNPSLPDTV
jgi:hypothetical protein